MNKLTPNEMLVKGLRRVGITKEEQDRRSTDTNVDDFVSCFGINPEVACHLWTLLQTTNNLNARIDPKKHFVHDFLTALHWLKVYPTRQHARIFMKVGEKTGSKWSWFYTNKIAALKEELIVWPATWDTIFTVTVDGVHFRIKEPTPPPDETTGEEYRFDKGYFSHKDGGPGLSYEIAISIFTQRVVWVNGPFKAGKGDLDIFKSGLKAKIPKGKRVLGDRGYRGLPEIISFHNSLDTDEVREFKDRALSRHENFNERIERFAVLKQVFRHKHRKHGLCFNACVVLCQLDLIHKSPLFEV